jgi:hypothetical protein
MDTMTIELDSARQAIDTLATRFFECVSFTAGERPDYAGIRTLFVPTGILFKGVRGGVEATTVSEFIEPRQASFDNGTLTEFSETELSASTSIFGNAANRQSVYDKAGVTGGTPFTGRGIIFTQCVFLDGAWLMSSMAWDDERDGLALSDLYTA